MALHTDEMEKNIARCKVIKVLIVLGLIFTGVLGYRVYWLFYDWSRFKQELIAESTSPNGTYTVKAYASNIGATVSYAVLGELVFNEEYKGSRKIYWQYKEDTANIKWVDEDTVRINDVELELPDEAYDYRSGIK